jgi:HEAT repeat protein
MSHQITVLKVFIASPGDLMPERQALREVVDKLNKACEAAANMRIHLLGWEDTMPGCGRPQALINEDLDKADLFVGVMWKRWGMPPGENGYTSGFEEEFERALKSYREQGRPEIWQFFKKVDDASVSDPGQGLQKVLDFKQGIIENRSVFFKEFHDQHGWEEQIHNLLLQQLLKLQKQDADTASTSANRPAEHFSANHQISMPTSDSEKLAKRACTMQIVELCKKVSHAIDYVDGKDSEVLEILDGYDIARFGLMAFNLLNRDQDGPMLEPHMINTLYRSRDLVALSPGESLLVLRSNLQNRNANTPGWYWLKDLPFDAAAILAYLSYGDMNFSIRKAALELCAKANISLFIDAGDGLTAVGKVCRHTDSETRKEGLKYLAAAKSKESMAIVNKMLLDHDPEVARLAYQTDFALAAERDATQAFRDLITRPKPAEEWQIKILRKYADQIPGNLLSAALTHDNRYVRKFAAITMAKRGLLDADMIPDLNLTDPGELWQEFYLKRIQLGDRPSIKEIRSRVGSDLFGLLSINGQTPDPRNVIRAIFQTMSYEELLPYAQPYQEEALIAYEVLATEHFEAFSSMLVRDLREGFAHYGDAVNSTSPASKGVFSEQAASPRTPFVIAAIGALEQHGGPCHRSVLEGYLHHVNDQIHNAVVRALGTCGEKEDNDLLMELARSTNSVLARTAAEAVIKLNPGAEEILGYFLNSSDPLVFKFVTQSLADMNPDLVMPMIKIRLHDTSEKIRAIACAYVVSHLTNDESEELLSWYLSTNSYYYDVVFHLDRILYGAPPLNEVFRANLLSLRERNLVFDF